MNYQLTTALGFLCLLAGLIAWLYHCLYVYINNSFDRTGLLPSLTITGNTVTHHSILFFSAITLFFFMCSSFSKESMFYGLTSFFFYMCFYCTVWAILKNTKWIALSLFLILMSALSVLFAPDGKELPSIIAFFIGIFMFFLDNESENTETPDIYY